MTRIFPTFETDAGQTCVTHPFVSPTFGTRPVAILYDPYLSNIRNGRWANLCNPPICVCDIRNEARAILCDLCLLDI